MNDAPGILSEYRIGAGFAFEAELKEDVVTISGKDQVMLAEVAKQLKSFVDSLPPVAGQEK